MGTPIVRRRCSRLRWFLCVVLAVVSPLGAAALALTLLASSAPAATLSTLASFNGANGAHPAGNLIADAAGNLYGTAYSGGSANLGTVFRLNASNNSLTTLASLNAASGYNPRAGLLADAAGNLYGTTTGGGASGQGTVFKLNASNNALTALVSFHGTNGAFPFAPVIADAAGNLYGTTELGGSGGYGTVFTLKASNNYALTTLATFTGNNDGDNLYAGVIADAAGNLYGTTYGDLGTVYKLNASNNYALTTLATFNAWRPSAVLLADAAGNLYGTTEAGGSSGFGTVFKLDASNNYAATTLTSFNGSNGDSPEDLIADAAGNLYGTTFYGGSSNLGTVFKLDVSNNYALSTLVSFTGGINGYYPSGGLLADAGGNLYGMTAQGGSNSDGIVFRLSDTGFVPEPSCLSLLVLAAPVCFRRRRSWPAR